MRRLLIVLLIGLPLISNAQTTQEFPVLKGDYLGQKPPGIIPEVFAPGIVSDTSWAEHCQVAISPSGDEIFWSAWTSMYKTEDGKRNTEQIFYSKLKNGIWTKPVIAKFIKNNKHGLNGGPVYSPDGNKLYFYQVKSPWVSSAMNTYYIEKINGEWSTEPINVGNTYNFDNRNYTPVFTKKGNAYKNSSYTGKYKYDNGKFEFVDTIFIHKDFRPRWSIYMSPHEDYVIFSAKHESGFGDFDLYISFKNQDNSWEYPIIMRDGINTNARERFPVVSPDGKYLFFMRHTKTQDIFWVSTKIFDKYRKESIETMNSPLTFNANNLKSEKNYKFIIL